VPGNGRRILEKYRGEKYRGEFCTFNDDSRHDHTGCGDFRGCLLYLLTEADDAALLRIEPAP
jgi:hypothetical protein